LEPEISLARQNFLVPYRDDLPPLEKYAHLTLPDDSTCVVGYTEASRGCKHLCRHCPIVPVYNGTFRIVQCEVVLEDIRRQVAAGAQHITFGDPDFFNGVGHSMQIVEALHREHPGLSYDVTIEAEHLLKHAGRLPALRETGCAFVTTAVESVDDHVLRILDKGHTRADFIRLAGLMRGLGLFLVPTFSTPRKYDATPHDGGSHRSPCAHWLESQNVPESDVFRTPRTAAAGRLETMTYDRCFWGVLGTSSIAVCFSVVRTSLAAETSR
jgi:hypothetical protein